MTGRIYRWLFGLGRSSLPVRDDGPVQTVQVRLSGRELLDAREVLTAYGLISAPPPGTDMLLVCGSGDRSDSVVVAHNHQKYRFRGAETGETGLHNGVAGSTILLKANGDVLIIPGSGKVVVQGTVTAKDFITEAGIKLSDHTHGGVKAGSDTTSGPQG
ncbi:phage baseplate assembly protein [Acetobacter orientalis]|uniref:phage baseplate assembly protein domain-containing protein n=1 Tax=Acetobacter orientalis TaxID=146474 RepID=UPI0039EB14B6